MDLDGRPAQRRRRGQELEDALLDAAWAELVAHGYGALTIDAVAQRAGTSRPVLYRRWATKAELVLAAVAHVGLRDRMPDPDTGSLREDLMAVMRYANEHRIGITVLVTVYLGGYFQETGTTPADLREALIAGQPTLVDEIVDRAIERGEVDAARITPRLRTLAYDLYRHEALMTLAPVPESVLAEILDEVYLPLVTGSVPSDA
jgi:AcrR family transcriptional regulator